MLQDGNGDWFETATACRYGQTGDRIWVRETWTPGYDPGSQESEGDDETAIIHHL